MGEATEGRVCAGGCGKSILAINRSGYCEKCWKKSPEQKAYQKEWYRLHRNPNCWSVTCRGCGKKLKSNTKTGYCSACWLTSPERRARGRITHNAWDRKRMATPDAKTAVMVKLANARAAKSGIPCGVTLRDLLPLPTVCPVLGLALDYARGPRTHNSASLDRIIPSLGYVAGNVRIISWRANCLKRDGTPDELYAVAMDAMRVAKRIV